MNREQKNEIVKDLTDKLESIGNFYLTDVSHLTVNEINDLRKTLHDKGISLQVVKNTLVQKALKNAKIENEQLEGNLIGPSSIIFCEKVNEPAKIIKEFRKSHERPLIKLAYLEENLYIGDNVDQLAKLKSKEDLIADLVHLLKSPMITLLGSLQSGQNNLTGVLKTLSEKK